MRSLSLPPFRSFSPPPPPLLLPSLCSFPFSLVFLCTVPPPRLYPALTFILPYLSSSATTALVFFIFHSTFILPFLLYFNLSFPLLPALSLCFLFPLSFPFSYDNIFLSPTQHSIGFSFFIAAFFLLNTPNLSLSLALFLFPPFILTFSAPFSPYCIQHSSSPFSVPIQAGVITGAIIGVVLGLLVLIVVIYYLMRFLVARRVFSLSVRSVTGLWPAALCQSGLCQGLEQKPEPIPGIDTCVAKLA